MYQYPTYHRCIIPTVERRYNGTSAKKAGLVSARFFVSPFKYTFCSTAGLTAAQGVPLLRRSTVAIIRVVNDSSMIRIYRSKVIDFYTCCKITVIYNYIIYK